MEEKNNTNTITIVDHKYSINWLDIIISLFLSLAFTVSPYYINNGKCRMSMGILLTGLILFFVILFSMTWVRFLLVRNAGKLDSNNLYNQNCRIYRSLQSLLTHPHHIIIIGLIIFICWLPSLICLYPGTCVNDTWGQLQQFIGFCNGESALYDHHPILDTLLMGAFIVPLAKITGEWHLVMFLYVLIQAFITSIVFSYTIDYAYKKLELNVNVLTVLLLFYCLLIVYPALVQTISKDSLFSWIFILFTVTVMEITRTKGDCLLNNKILILFVIVSILCCLTKKVGFYVVLLSQAVILLFQRKNRNRIAISIAAVLVMMLVIMPVLKSLLDVEPGGKQEMLSLPFQMTARYVTYYPEDVTEQEKLVIDKVLDYDALPEQYDPVDADPVKHFSQKGEDSDYSRYLIVWAKQGLRHPQVYIAAINSMLSGWFSWAEYDPQMNMDWHGQLIPELIPEGVTQRGVNKTIADGYQEMFNNLYQTPVINIFLSFGLYSALIPFFAISIAFSNKNIRKERYWLTLLPMILSIALGCWLGPESTHLEGRRYLYPIVYTTPIIVMWCIYIIKQQNCMITKGINNRNRRHNTNDSTTSTRK